MKLVSIIFLVVGCAPLKPYEKEYLLHPTMSDAASVEGIGEGALRKREKLTAFGGSASSSACPSCGG
jgi:hypothetical protein